MEFEVFCLQHPPGHILKRTGEAPLVSVTQISIHIPSGFVSQDWDLSCVKGISTCCPAGICSPHGQVKCSHLSATASSSVFNSVEKRRQISPAIWMTGEQLEAVGKREPCSAPEAAENNILRRGIINPPDCITENRLPPVPGNIPLGCFLSLLVLHMAVFTNSRSAFPVNNWQFGWLK